MRPEHQVALAGAAFAAGAAAVAPPEPLSAARLTTAAIVAAACCVPLLRRDRLGRALGPAALVLVAAAAPAPASALWAAAVVLPALFALELASRSRSSFMPIAAAGIVGGGTVAVYGAAALFLPRSLDTRWPAFGLAVVFLVLAAAYATTLFPDPHHRDDAA